MDSPPKPEVALSNSLIELLATKNFTEYMRLIEAKPHKDMSPSQVSRFLAELITYIADNDIENSLEYTLSKFTNDFDDDVSGVVGDLVSIPLFSIRSIRYVLDKLPHVTVMEIIESQFEISGGVSIKYINKRLSEAMGEPAMDSKQMGILLNRANKTNIDKNGESLNWLKGEFKRKEVADKPSWVSIKGDESKETFMSREWYEKEDEGKKMDSLEAIQAVMSEFTIKGKDGKDVDPSVLSEVIDKSRSVDTPFKKGLPGNPDRYFGPLNNSGDDRDCRTSAVGDGCRMLTCNCRRYEDEEYNRSTSPISWFTGNCDECTNTILNESHSIRYPVNGGGWIGCFCSYKCMKINKGTDSEVESSYVNTFYQTLGSMGIVDRQTWAPPVKEHSTKILMYSQSKATRGLMSGVARRDDHPDMKEPF